MNLMEALKCDFCGGRLVMDDSREFATCEMCGTKYMKSTIQQKVQEIRGSVAIEGDVSVKQADFIIRGGVLEKYNGSSIEVTIPDSVTHIGREAFKDCKGIKSVVIPNTVKEIGELAFQRCESLVDISISEGVTSMCMGVFHCCKSLVSIKIPNGVTKISSIAFGGCKNLKSVSIPESVSSIDENAFFGCDSLVSINIPDGVSKIDNGAFSNCVNLSEVVLPLRLRNDAKTILGSSFHNTPFQKTFIYNMRRGRCRYCGGVFRGIISKVCSNCGKPKDY